VVRTPLRLVRTIDGGRAGLSCPDNTLQYIAFSYTGITYLGYSSLQVIEEQVLNRYDIKLLHTATGFGDLDMSSSVLRLRLVRLGHGVWFRHCGQTQMGRFLASLCVFLAAEKAECLPPVPPLSDTTNARSCAPADLPMNTLMNSDMYCQR